MTSKIILCNLLFLIFTSLSYGQKSSKDKPKQTTDNIVIIKDSYSTPKQDKSKDSENYGKSNLEIKPYTGLSTPIGKFSQFSKVGAVVGLSTDYFFTPRFGLGIDINSQFNAFKNPTDFSRIPEMYDTDYTDTFPSQPVNIIESQNGAWNTTTFSFGPTYRMNYKKFGTDLYAKVGVSFLRTPEASIIHEYDFTETDLFRLNNQNAIAFGVTSGIRFYYHLNKKLSLYVNPQIVYTTANVDYTIVNDLDPAFNTGSLTEDPETGFDREAVRNVIAQEESFNPLYFNLNAGISLNITSKERNKEDKNEEDAFARSKSSTKKDNEEKDKKKKPKGNKKVIREEVNEDCRCKDPKLAKPRLQVIQHNFQNNPREITVSGIDEYIDNLWTCLENYDSSTHDARVYIQWSTNENSELETEPYTHTFGFDEEIPEFVKVLIRVYPKGEKKEVCFYNSSADLPVWMKELNKEENKDICKCTDKKLEEPVLNVFRPEPQNYPYRLTLAGVIPYRDYLVKCNENINLEKFVLEVSIDWGDGNIQESLVNDGPFIHDYSMGNKIPDEICATFTIKPRFENKENKELKCEIVRCAKPSEEWIELTQVDSGSISLGDSIYAGEHVGEHGEFLIVTTELTGSAPGPYSGKGTTRINWLNANMAVEFTNITVDQNNNLLTGVITAQVGADANRNLGDLALNQLDHEKIEDIIGWVEDRSGQQIDYNPAVLQPDLKIPLGLIFPTDDQIVITEMFFRHNKSDFNLVYALTTLPEWGGFGEGADTIGFVAKEVEFHVDSIEAPKRIELLEDVTIGNTNLMEQSTFTFKAPTADNPGCFVEWNEHGFSNYAMELDVGFPRKWLIPLPDDSNRATLNLLGEGSAWRDFMLTGSLEKSIVASTIPNPEEPTDSSMYDFTIWADSVTYDWSDIQNPHGISFPNNYRGDSTNLFTGFYAKTIGLELSTNKIRTPDDQPISLEFNNMIINSAGITVKVEAENIVVFGGAEAADMAVSLDHLNVELINSDLVEAGIDGRIIIPVSDNEGAFNENTLAYAALFNNPQDPDSNSNFQITLEPDQPINNDLFGGGQFTLDATSNLHGYFDKDKTTFNMDLNGGLVWEDITLGPIDNVDMQLNFEGVGFDYNTTRTSNKLMFNEGTWAFASPQKFIANFPVTIENIGFDQLDATGNQLLRGNLTFDVIANLSENIGGQTGIAVEGAIEDDSGSSGSGKFKPVYVGTSMEDISIFAHLPAVTINGTLQLRNGDNMWGNGFKGTLNAAFKTPNMGIDAMAEFGNTEYLNNGVTYRYWRVEAAAKFSPGLPFLPGVAFNGFGGGAFNNMEGQLVASTGDGPNDTPAHRTFTPRNGNLGFEVEATIASHPETESFNADVGLNGQFSRSQGLINIGFTGDFYVGGPLTPQTERDKAQVKGNVIVDYNFPNKHFFMNVDAHINADPVSTPPSNPANMNIDINGMNNLWHFKLGIPTAPNTVNIFGASMYEYLMFGNNIPTPSAFTQRFQDNYERNMESSINLNGHGKDDNSELGKGFAFGVGFEFEYDKVLSVTKEPGEGIDLFVDIEAGAEVNASMMKKIKPASCSSYTDGWGLNGWRVNGSAGFYTSILAGVTWPQGRKTVDMAAGGYFIGTFAKPTYVSGTIAGRISIFLGNAKAHFWDPCGNCSTRSTCTHYNNRGNLKHTSFHCSHPLSGCSNKLAWNCDHMVPQYLINRTVTKSFEWGTKCEGTNATSNQTYQQQDAAGDQAERLITYIHPESEGIVYDFPVTTPFSVKFGLAPNEVFDVTEQQSNGAIKTRTFKLEREVSLLKREGGNFVEIENNNTLNNLMAGNSTATGLNMHKNNLDEELYVIETFEIVNELNAMATIADINNLTYSDNSTNNNANNLASINTEAVRMMPLASYSNGSLNTGAYEQSYFTTTSAQTMSTLRYPAAPSTTGPPVSESESPQEDEIQEPYVSGNPNYGTIPPPAPPVVNTLEENKVYRLVVTATLKEKIDEVWVEATDSSGNIVTETKSQTVKTGPQFTISNDTSPNLQQNSNY